MLRLHEIFWFFLISEGIFGIQSVNYLAKNASFS